MTATTKAPRRVIARKPRQPRIPPGQTATDKFPLLTYGRTPAIDLAEWRLGVFGLVEADVELTWEAFLALPQTRVVADFHCGTLWSRLDNHWVGVLFRDVVGLARPREDARFVMVHSYGGYSTNLDLATLMEEDVILARAHNAEELTPDHGWPLRLVVPSRYGWKNAKWVCGLELAAEDSPGFWEKRGFHMRGDPWKEERFWPEMDASLALTLAICSDKL
ncbi:MAG: sulfite oxidase-like oxidoreductase [Chloroflexi bacterium]|nr:sulfite oxidase-like oxidoreductase [Chloroflexota bacterium]